MKHFIRCSAIVLSMASLTPNVHATHLMGSDLGYKHVGGNDYEVTLTIFRDCAGIPGAAYEMLVSVSSQCQLSSMDTLHLYATEIIGPGCSNFLSWCQGGQAPGMEVRVYRDTITMIAACPDWELKWWECCRNAVVTNLVNPSSVGAMNIAVLDNLNAPSNSSPVFQELQFPFLCTTSLFCLNNGAYDADGDSLVYSMIAPLSESGFPLPYNPGYSITDPFPAINGHSFDPVTGNHCSEPATNGSYALAYRVEEYRNGVLIGSVMRDIQMWVIACPGATLGFQGTVTDTTGVAVSSGDVELYTYGLNSAGSLLYGSTTVNGAGEYSFANVPYGQYILRAIPDTLNYPNTAGTYWLNTYLWTYAEVESALCDSTFTCDIELVGYGNLNGSGYVSGYLGDLGISRSSGPGVAWEGGSIILESWPARELVAYTRTDANGEFSFNAVPYGTYRIVADHPGLPMIDWYVFTLSALQPAITGLDHGADPLGIRTFTSVGVEDVMNTTDTYVFVESSGSVVIQGLQDGPQTTRVLDQQGRLVYTTNNMVTSGRMEMDLRTLAAGHYLIQVGGTGFRVVLP